jgi:hypothetical protein
VANFYDFKAGPQTFLAAASSQNRIGAKVHLGLELLVEKSQFIPTQDERDCLVRARRQ